MRETWFVLENGEKANPAEVAVDEKGVLNHKGVPVAMKGDVHHSTGVDLDESGKPLFGGKGDHDNDGTAAGAKTTGDMKPEPPKESAKKPGYKTRETKAKS